MTLRVACQRVADPNMCLCAELIVDEEPFAFTVDCGVVDVKAGNASSPEAVVATSYEPMIAVADGRMSLDEFSSRHLEISGAHPSQGRALAELMGRAIAQMTGAD